MLHRPLFRWTCLVLALSCQPALVAQERGMIVFGAGLWDVPDRYDVAELDIEWRSRPRAWKLQLEIGAKVNADSGTYAYAGVRRDFYFSELWGTSIGLGAGAYDEGDGIDLGGTFQFNIGIELFRDLGERSRLALGYYHLSHAGINGELNPGANSAILLYGFRFKSGDSPPSDPKTEP